MLLVVRNKFLIHIEYAEDKYKNYLDFNHIESKAIIYMQALALVVYTCAENVACLRNRIWQISSCYSMNNLHLCFGILMKIANTVYEQCIQTASEREMILFTNDTVVEN